MRRLKMIVPYVADGGSDRRVRLVAKYLGPLLGRPIDVENVTGAVRGYEHIAEARPDGDLIGMIANEVNMMHWFGETSLISENFTALAKIYAEPSAVIVRTDSPFRNLGECLSTFRTNRLKGTGSPAYGIWKFGMDGLLRRVGISPTQLEWLPTISGEEGVAKVIAGEADLAPVALAEAADFVRDKAVRGLATFASGRLPDFPDVPTVSEAIGVSWELSVWRGFVAPAGLMLEESRTLTEALRSLSANDQFKAEAMARGYALSYEFGDAFAESMRLEDALMKEAIIG